MAISDKTRKLIWGRSGNQCAYCRRELLMEARESDPAAVVGDECHIIGPKEGSPRFDATYSADLLDACENLILLCKIHHKMVDDQPVEFSTHSLRTLKARHEQRVRAALQVPASGSSPTHVSMPRIKTGRELLQVLIGAHGYDFDHDDPRSEAEAELLGGFLQDARDWGEVGDDLEPRQRVQAGYDLTRTIEELEAAGFVILASRTLQSVRAGGGTDVWPIATPKMCQPFRSRFKTASATFRSACS